MVPDRSAPEPAPKEPNGPRESTDRGKTDGPPNLIGLFLLLLVACAAEWGAAAHASHVPYQASLFVFAPIIAIVYGMAAGLLCRHDREALIYATLPLLSRGLGVLMVVGNAGDSGSALLPMIAILGVPGWLVSVAAFAVVYFMRSRVFGKNARRS